MALVLFGQGVADMRGSIGGTTFARNRGGAIARNRTIPLNPATTRQQAVRERLGGLAVAWSDELTEVQRQSWDTYAENVPVPNALGQLRNLSGNQMYIKGNSVLLEAGMARADDGPTTFTLGPTFTPTLVLAVATQDLTVSAIPGSDPATQPFGFSIQMGVPQQAGRNFFKGPFQLADSRELTAALDIPYTIATLPFPFVAGQAVFIRSRAVLPDGRLGGAVTQRFLAA